MITIIAGIVGLILLALLGVTGAIYIRRSERPVNKSKTFEERKEWLGVIDKGTSMDEHQIYAYSSDEIGL